jgi:hypothetical protein
MPPAVANSIAWVRAWLEGCAAVDAVQSEILELTIASQIHTSGTTDLTLSYEYPKQFRYGREVT